MNPNRHAPLYHAFNAALHGIVPYPCHDRPFVCNARPEECDVLIIGENPGTRLPANWWSYWTDDRGFDFNKFDADYKAWRIAAGKPATSPTRRRLDRLREHGLRCVETNIFRNERPDGAGPGTTNTDVLKLLIAHMPWLRAIIVHGRKAVARYDVLDMPRDVCCIATRHFSRIGYAEVDTIVAGLPPAVR